MFVFPYQNQRDINLYNFIYRTPTLNIWIRYWTKEMKLIWNCPKQKYCVALLDPKLLLCDSFQNLLLFQSLGLLWCLRVDLEIKRNWAVRVANECICPSVLKKRARPHCHATLSKCGVGNWQKQVLLLVVSFHKIFYFFLLFEKLKDS